MKWMPKIIIFMMINTLFISCDAVKRFRKKAQKISRYEKVSLHLSKENRELKAAINRLNYQIEELRSKKKFLEMKLEKKGGRSVASIAPVSPKNDLVKYKIYKWGPAQMLATAEKEFDNKNYEKSAQFFQTFVKKFPKHEYLNDQLLFQSGMAAFETGKHNDWALKDLRMLVKKYPNSRFYRGAKLWIALAHLKLGKKQKFFKTVEEFRKNYRNTPEWKILSGHYDKMLFKFKK